MSKTQGLRVLVKEFLSATADQIVEAVEKMISGYEEELFQSKRKISRRRKLLDVLPSTTFHLLPQPEIRLNGISEEALNLSVWEEDLLTEQEWNSCDIPVKHFLSVAADRIVEAVEKTISGYKGEMHQSKREISRQCKMLNTLLQPEIRLTRIPGKDEIDKVEEPLIVTSAEQMPIEADEEVPSPGFSEPENEDDDVWNAIQDGHSDGSEEWSPTPNKQHCTVTGDPPQTKRKKKCKICGKSFHYEGSFLKHLKSHPKDDCGLCGMPFKTEEDFELHLKTHKNEMNREHHTLTDKTTKTNKKSCTCKVCGKSFHYKGYFLKHLKSHPKDDCGLCGMPFKTEEDFELHLKTHKNEMNREHHTLTDKTPKTNKKSCTCKVCGKSFHYEGYLMKHLKSHPKDDCGLCGMHFKTEEDFELHLNTHKSEIATRKKAKVVCDVCGRSFAAVWLLELHMRSHSSEKPFTCEVCGKSFKFPQSLTIHVRNHAGGKSFRCELCGKSFNFQQALTRHHLIHAGEKPYACTICSEHFIRYSTLRKHMRTHLKRKRITITSTTPVYDDRDVDAEVFTKEQLVRIICKVCGKAFHSKVSLMNHLKSHPKDDCGLCGMQFNTEEEFEHHLKTHENEIAKVCDVCGKCFAKPFYLEKHIRSHTGVKRFKCNVCDKSFRNHGALMDHSRIHTGEKPFSCITCSKRFRTKTNLNQHMKRCRII